jgi:hypothetical protein
VIRTEAKIREEEWLPAWLRAAALGLDRNEHRVDLGNGVGVVRLQHPAFLARVVLIKKSEANGVLPVGAPAAPGLKDASLLDAGLLIEIVSIEDERFVLGVENSAEGLLCIPALADIVDFGDIEVAGANQIPDIAIAVKQFPAVGDLFVFFLDRFIEIVDLPFEYERLLGVLGGLFADQAESCFKTQGIGLRFGQFPIQAGAFLDAAVKVGAPVCQFPCARRSNMQPEPLPHGFVLAYRIPNTTNRYPFHASLRSREWTSGNWLQLPCARSVTRRLSSILPGCSAS